MYLSRIELDTTSKNTMKALSSPKLLHNAVEKSYTGERKRILWRVDWLGEVCYLLIVSEDKPDLTFLSHQFGQNQTEPYGEIKNYDPLLDRLQEGQLWRFRLCANPTHSSFKEKGESGRGKVFAHVTVDQQRQWLLNRSEKLGFKLLENHFDVVQSRYLGFPKDINGNQKVFLRTATFEGILTVQDPVIFRNTLLYGIGRAKAYGCGLITIARYEANSNE